MENKLFINNGDGSFKESAQDYGLADSGYSTHTVLFDYDGDGDLEVLGINHDDHLDILMAGNFFEVKPEWGSLMLPKE